MWTQGDVGSDWKRSDLGPKGGRHETNLLSIDQASFWVKFMVRLLRTSFCWGPESGEILHSQASLERWGGISISGEGIILFPRLASLNERQPTTKPQ